MKTTRGREIKKLGISVDRRGWNWHVRDSKGEEMLDADEIRKLNEYLESVGVKINKTTMQYPLAQVLCG